MRRKGEKPKLKPRQRENALSGCYKIANDLNLESSQLIYIFFEVRNGFIEFLLSSPTSNLSGCAHRMILQKQTHPTCLEYLHFIYLYIVYRIHYILGEQGLYGLPGLPGQQGEKGVKGDAGPRGERGEKGEQVNFIF